MKEEDIERLSPEIKETEEWDFASSAYSEIYFSFPWAELTLGNDYDPDIEEIEALEQLIIDFPAFYPAYVDLGTKKLSHDYEEAVELIDTGFKISMRINALDVIEEEFYTFSENMENIFHSELIIRYCLKLLEKFPGKAFLYDHLCMAYGSLGDFGLANESGNKAVELDPFNSHYLCNLGYNLMMSENFDEAIRNFELAISINNDDKISQENLKLCTAIKNSRLSSRKFYLQPIDYNKVSELNNTDNYIELENYVIMCNYMKMEMYKFNISENYQGQSHPYHGFMMRLIQFFKVANNISDTPVILEDVRWLKENYESVMHEYIDEAPYKEGALDTINSSIMTFYKFLFDNKVISADDYSALIDVIDSLEDDLEEIWIENQDNFD